MHVHYVSMTGIFHSYYDQKASILIYSHFSINLYIVLMYLKRFDYEEAVEMLQIIIFLLFKEYLATNLLMDFVRKDQSRERMVVVYNCEKNSPSVTVWKFFDETIV